MPHLLPSFPPLQNGFYSATQLFDLQADPHEMTDLGHKPEQTDRIKTLLAVLMNQQQQFGDKAPLKVANPLDPAWSPDMARKKATRRQRDN